MSGKKIRVFDTFAGYGGAHFGFKKTKIPHEVVGFSEIDSYADYIYKHNHGDIKNFGDITKINPKDLPDFDVFTGGFPCQPFSQAGARLGELDTRGTLFYDIIRICSVKKPKIILLENVKGITTKKHTHTLEKIVSELKKIGYNVDYKVLNSKNFGIPQNRERLWIVASKKKFPKNWDISPEKVELKLKFKDLLDKKVPEKYYLTDLQIARIQELIDEDYKVKEPLCLDIYNKKIKRDGVSITITEPHHNSLRVVEPPKKGKIVIRKLTPTETFRFMGFQNDEIKFGELSDSQIYKRAGNGWDVNVASKIIKNIIENLY
jgi:DNA (cytosine-5)-methyltransferase 1